MTDKPKLWSEMTTEEVKQTVKKALEHISKNSVLVDYPKAIKKLANPKRKNKVCKDVVREIITDEDYQQLIEERNELVSKCRRLQNQLKEANSVIKRYGDEDNWFTVDYDALQYLEKWGVK